MGEAGALPPSPVSQRSRQTALKGREKWLHIDLIAPPTKPTSEKENSEGATSNSPPTPHHHLAFCVALQEPLP